MVSRYARRGMCRWSHQAGTTLHVIADRFAAREGERGVDHARVVEDAVVAETLRGQQTRAAPVHRVAFAFAPRDFAIVDIVDDQAGLTECAQSLGKPQRARVDARALLMPRIKTAAQMIAEAQETEIAVDGHRHV